MKQKKIAPYLLLASLVLSSAPLVVLGETTTTTTTTTVAAETEVPQDTSADTSTSSQVDQDVVPTPEEPQASTEPSQTIDPKTAVKPSYVFGKDDRIQISQPTVTPYKEVVYIEVTFKNGSRAIGSGALIAPNKVLTAAHVLQHDGTGEWATQAVVVPGFAGGQFFYEGSIGVVYHLFTSYKDDLPGYSSSKMEDDLAVITLEEPLPEPGFLAVNDQVALNQRVQVVGYPGEKGGYLYTATGPIIDQDGTLLQYRIDMTPGNSGGPVLNEQNEIVGVNVAEPNVEVFGDDFLQQYGTNYARDIDEDALELIDAAKNNESGGNGISKLIPTYRLYHAGIKYHFYTTDLNEYRTLIGRGWKDEGLAWRTDTQGKPVYRLYHKGIKHHLYTTDANEKNVLSRSGWNYEGIAWYSSGNRNVYRLYHSGLKVHLYTMDENEYRVLATRGWKQEGVAWNVE